MDIISGGYRSIDEWCYAYDEIDLKLACDVIKYLHWKTIWLINSMIGQDFSKF